MSKTATTIPHPTITLPPIALLIETSPRAMFTQNVSASDSWGQTYCLNPAVRAMGKWQPVLTRWNYLWKMNCVGDRWCFLLLLIAVLCRLPYHMPSSYWRHVQQSSFVALSEAWSLFFVMNHWQKVIPMHTGVQWPTDSPPCQPCNHVGYREAYLLSHHHLYADNFFSSIPLVRDLIDTDTYYCGTVRPSHKNSPKLQRGQSMKWSADNLMACR